MAAQPDQFQDTARHVGEAIPVFQGLIQNEVIPERLLILARQLQGALVDRSRCLCGTLADEA